MKKKLIVVAFLVLLIGVASFVYVGQHRERSAELYYSGTIEATESELAFQTSGRVHTVHVDDGYRVEEGDILAELGKRSSTARRDQAAANLEGARERLAQLEAVLNVYNNTLPAEVERAQAGVNALRARLEELEAGFRRQEVERARLAYEAARIAMDEALRDKNRFDALYEERIVSVNERDEMALKYETALREYERAREAFSLAREGYRRETIAAARAQLAEGEAALKQAKGNLTRIDAAARDVEAARAQVAGAESALRLADIQLSYTQLLSPFAGIITSRNVEPGEVVASGREVISLADLSAVDLKIFVDETQIGKVKHGQQVEVKTDTFPDKSYEGRVSFISPEAEFTPKMIQTHKERVKLVYLVKIAIPNPDLELKPGMPADAWFR